MDFLRSRGRSVVTPKMQHNFTRDICNGMAYLEKRKVVHRWDKTEQATTHTTPTNRHGDAVFAPNAAA